jgi:putative ABC transport system permease protein
MRSARLSKILGDLRSSPGRTIVVVLSITVGVTAVGMVVGARSLMLRALDDSRREGHFASATLLTDGPIPRGLGETRRIVHARIGTRELILSSLPGSIDRVTPEHGAWPPPLGTIAVERSSHLHGIVRITLPNGVVRNVPVSGVVHDVNVPPTRTYGVLSAYATTATLAQLGVGTAPNELLLPAGGEAAAAHARRELMQRGVSVTQTIVPKPGAFWAEDPVRAMVLLLTVLAVVCLFMSAFLVVNIVSALVAQQTPQIGVMKAVGARAPAAAGLYLTAAGLYGLAALVVAIPVAAAAALALVSYSAGLINLNVPGFTIPLPALVVEVAAAILLPLLAAFVPVALASRITVREAIARDGSAEERPAMLVGGFLPVAFRLALANTLRRKRRLLLATGALALAGAVFIGVLSVRASLYRTLDEGALYHRYGVDVMLDRDYPAAAVARAMRGLRSEAWSVEGAYRVRPDGSESQTFSVVAAPPGSTLLRPLIVRGRALRPGDRNAVVVNTDVLDSEHSLKPGDVIRLSPGGDVRVVGIAQRILTGPVIYANAPPGAPVRRVVAVTTNERLVVARLRHAGIRIASVHTSKELSHYDHANFATIVSFLLAMAVLLAVVGGLGLAGMLSVSVLERSREIGVLRAVGARDGDVLQLVIVEGLFVAALGCLVAAPAGWLVGRALSDAVGRLFLGAPLQFAYPGSALLVWLGLTGVLAVAASYVPARRASRLTIRDVLAYE